VPEDPDLVSDLAPPTVDDSELDDALESEDFESEDLDSEDLDSDGFESDDPPDFSSAVLEERDAFA
jgi:hypothetical protein